MIMIGNNGLNAKYRTIRYNHHVKDARSVSFRSELFTSYI